MSTVYLVMRAKYFRWIPLLYFKIFHRVKFYGYENIPDSGPVVIAPNHVSFYDPILVGIGIKRDLRYMAWERLFSIPVLKGIIRFFGAFPVNITKFDKAAYVNALKALSEGEALVIFPEGGRSADGKMKDCKLGFARIACKTKAPIIPVTIVGAYEAWPRQRKLPRPRQILVYYHNPVRMKMGEFADMKARNEFFTEVTNRVAGAISSKLPV
ncbi:MAG: 1-acyl-sn-glycerol-3-phosphate acyltransferase [Candidatus Scalindua sp.]|nr:1-acyl-sn-glycerol-3-phosphate acyltransferase [Candidatus Scalindua sp.]